MVVCVLQSRYLHWARFGQFVFQCFVCFWVDLHWSKLQSTWNVFKIFVDFLQFTISLHVPFRLWHLDVRRWTGMGRNGQESIGKGVNCVAISRSHECQERRKAKPNYDFSTSNHLEFDLVSDYYGKLGEDFILDELRCCVCWLSILIQIDSWELVQSIRKKGVV